MLLELKVTNFRSIAEEQVFSMLPSNARSRNHPTGNNYYPDSLKVAAVYGANGAGKTNFVSALIYLQHLVRMSGKFSSDHKISMEPHVLDKKFKSEPTVIEVLFSSNGDVWRYLVSTLKGEVVSELLSKRNKKPRSTERIIFDRENGLRHDDIKSYDLILKSQTNSNQLFLSKLDQNSDSVTKPAYDWLNFYLRLIRNIKDFPKRPTIDFCEENNGISKVVKFLQASSIAIESLEFTETEFDDDELTLIKSLLEAHNLPEGDLRKPPEVYFKLRARSGDTVPLNLSEESLGTQQLFALAGPILHALSQGFCLIIDELNQAFHTELQKHLLDLFISNETNLNHAQIIFTSHDTNLMNYLERDEIWIAQKNDDGASEYHSLSDMGPVRTGGSRRREPFEKRYLEGRYGGLPDIDFIESGKTIVTTISKE